MNCLSCIVECRRIKSLEEEITDLYFCIRCQEGYFFCIPCSDLFPFTRQLHKRHIRLSVHKKNVIKHNNLFISGSNLSVDNNDNTDGDNCDNNITFDLDASSVTNSQSMFIYNERFYDSLQFCTHENRSFFIDEVESYGLGVKNLILKSLTKDKNYYLHTNLPENIITLHKLIAGFCLNLTRNNCNKFSEIMQQIALCYPDSFALTSNVPTTYNNLRSTYLRGGFSIRDNLPIPKIYTKELAAYVLFSDLIKDLISIRITNVDVFNENHINDYIKSMKSERLNFLFDRYYDSNKMKIFILLSMWSDGFDPNAVCQNRGSAWGYSITIRIGFFTETLTLVIDTSKCDHNLLEMELIIDMIKMVNTPIEVFSMALKKFITIVVFPYSSKMDNPERRARLFLKYGNGFASQRFKFAYDPVSTLELLSSCKECNSKNKEMLQKLQNSDNISETNSLLNEYQQCCNWY